MQQTLNISLGESPVNNCFNKIQVGQGVSEDEAKALTALSFNLPMVDIKSGQFEVGLWLGKTELAIFPILLKSSDLPETNLNLSSVFNAGPINLPKDSLIKNTLGSIEEILCECYLFVMMQFGQMHVCRARPGGPILVNLECFDYKSKVEIHKEILPLVEWRVVVPEMQRQGSVSIN